MFVYSVAAHCLWSDDGKIITTKGASGYHEASNVSALDDLVDIGAIPLGLWQMLKAYNSRALGGVVIPLLPLNHMARCRMGFSIFGAVRKDKYANGIVLPITARNKLSRSNDKILLVIE